MDRNMNSFFFFFQAEDGIRDVAVTGVQTCALPISTSGESPNVIRAAQAAKARGVGVVALLGRTGGQLKELADLVLIVPSTETARIQELHLAIEHVICDLVEDRLKG